MNKIIVVVMSALLSMTACSKNDYDADGKKVADLMCKASSLQKRALENPSDTNLMLDATKVAAEGQLLLTQLEEKYKNQDQKNELLASYLSAVEKCKP